MADSPQRLRRIARDATRVRLPPDEVVIQGVRSLFSFSLAHALDARAAEAMGAEMRRVLWVQPPDAAGALRAADLLLASACFPLVVLYLAGVPPPRRMDHAWQRLAQRAAQAQAALLVVTDRPLAGPAAAVTLASTLVGVRWQRVPGGRQVMEGLGVRFSIERNRTGEPGAVTMMNLTRGV